jgi:hypothetical protein
LKDRFLFSDDRQDRRIFLHLVSMLLNFRTTFVGLNQLQSTFYPLFDQVGDDVIELLF